uniref:Aldehyde dehydrogenase family 8 member A1-like n=1 Tax=Phallusia mammillata TaxID=59560 RepID=A0A6F9D6Z2_9ASCI|nr:aldehyde dehydrogenase family 8 member A1-like [Phallusia mammillata]
MSKHQLSNFIGGKFVDPINSAYLDSCNPATGQVFAKVPRSGKEDVDDAVSCALKAFPSWSEQPTQFRSKVMLKIADILESRLDEFAKLESQDQGKPITVAKAIDIPRAIYNFRFFATYILHMVEEQRTLDGPIRALSYVQHMPVGVAGLISPWNLPLYLLTWKIAPAIAFGNTCVAKPSELTSLTAYKLCGVFNEAGLPPGVVNIVFGLGPDAGEALVCHPEVPLISFTGSTLVGNRIAELTAPMCKKLSLELGGKNAGIVYEDVDLDECVDACIRSSFSNQGEICLCTSRLYIHHSIYNDFLNRFVTAARNFRVGDPSDPNVNMGALVSAQHYEKVKGYIELAASSGGVVHCGLGVDELPQDCRGGHYIAPTVITGLTESSPCIQDEIFGPVVCISSFQTDEEVLKKANGVRYGLCATLWTKDVNRALTISRKLRVGTVWTNCWLVRDLHMPFGGMKMSGVGRESGADSKHFFTEAKTVCLRIK